jgi:hypothetical protein
MMEAANHGMRLRHGTKGKLWNGLVTGFRTRRIRVGTECDAYVNDGSLFVKNSAIWNNTTNFNNAGAIETNSAYGNDHQALLTATSARKRLVPWIPPVWTAGSAASPSKGLWKLPMIGRLVGRWHFDLNTLSTVHRNDPLGPRKASRKRGLPFGGHVMNGHTSNA